MSSEEEEEEELVAMKERLMAVVRPYLGSAADDLMAGVFDKETVQGVVRNEKEGYGNVGLFDSPVRCLGAVRPTMGDFDMEGVGDGFERANALVDLRNALPDSLGVSPEEWRLSRV